MQIGGIDSISKLRKIRLAFRDAPNTMKNVVQRSYAAGVANYNVDSPLPAEELAEWIVINHPEGVRFQVISIEKGKINLRVAGE
jgi:hypothetical protein